MRNLRILGTALVAMFALSAAFSAMASADTLTGETAKVTLTGSQVGLNNLNLPGLGLTECEVATFDATTATSVTKVASVAPTYSGCETAGLESTVAVNGCTYTLNEPVAGTTAGTADIVCPSEKEITITVIQAGTSKCTIHIKGGQLGLGKITYTNVAGPPKDLLLHIEITGIHAVKTAGTGTGACVAGTQTNASLSGTITVKADIDGTSTATGIFLS